MERGYVHCRKPIVVGQLSVCATFQQYRHSVPLPFLRCQHERGEMLRSFALSIDVGTVIQGALNLHPAVLIDRSKQRGVGSWGPSRRRLHDRQQQRQQAAESLLGPTIALSSGQTVVPGFQCKTLEPTVLEFCTNGPLDGHSRDNHLARRDTCSE